MPALQCQLSKTKDNLKLLGLTGVFRAALTQQCSLSNDVGLNIGISKESVCARFVRVLCVYEVRHTAHGTALSIIV